MSRDLARLHPSLEDERKDAPALGFSIQVDLGAGRTAVMQTHLPNDCALDEINAMFDKMNAAGDRQRAHYKIEEQEREIATVRKMQEGHALDAGRGEETYQKEQAARYEQAAKMQQTLDNFMGAARENHVASGRRTEFELRGPDKSRYNGVSSGLEKLKEEIAKADAEREVALARFAALRKETDRQLAKHEAEIARCRAIMAGPSTA